MRFQKISKNYFFIESGYEKVVLDSIQKFNKRIEKLREKGQLNENFSNISCSFHTFSDHIKEEIKKSGKTYDDFEKDFEKLKYKNNNYLIIKLNGISNFKLNNFQILGVVKPIENGEYTLNSYSDNDLPLQYRALENPNHCDHCNTNRYRKETFVIQDKNTSDVMQVGSSCMEDYISKNDLFSLINYAKIEDELKEKISSSPNKIFSLYNKNELIANFIAYNKEIKIKTFSHKYTKNNILKILQDMESNKRMFEVSEEDRDLADDVLDLFEDINKDINKYKDSIFNISKILNSNSDFLVQEEVYELADMLDFFDAYTKKNESYLKFLHQEEISQNNITKKDILMAAKIAFHSFPFVKPSDNELFNSTKYIMSIINPEKIDFYKDVLGKDFENIKEKIYLLNEQYKKITKEEKEEYYQEIINFFNENNSLSNFIYTLKSTVNLNEIDIKDKDDYLRKIIWVEKLRFENESKIKNFKVFGDVFEKEGDLFESWDLKVKKVSIALSDAYGYYTKIKFEDKLNNIIEGSIYSSDFDFSNTTDKILNIKGKYKNTYKQKLQISNIKVNSVKDDFDDCSPRLNNKEKYKIETLKLIEELDLDKCKIYVFVNKNGNKKQLMTIKDFKFENEEFYTIAYKGEIKLKNINEEFIKISNEEEFFSQNIMDNMTEAKVNSFFNIKKERKKKNNI